MRYIKRIDEFFGFSKSIETKLKEFGIENYTINEDGVIDVDGDVDISRRRLDKIPFKFGVVAGDFNCSNNKLTSLRGCPKDVGNHFICSYNKLKDLIGGPQEVGVSYLCSNNQLDSLEGCAGDIGENFYCLGNKLEMLDCSSVIDGCIYCKSNKFKEEPEFFGICSKIIWK